MIADHKKNNSVFRNFHLAKTDYRLEKLYNHILE